jgi:hypothetical protein
MITYHPPKSRWWGHQVSRLSAVQVVDRGLQFLSQKTSIREGFPSSELTVHWASVDLPAISGWTEKLVEALGAPAKEMDFRSHNRSISRQYKWTVPTDRLRAVAEWFDTIGPLLESKEVFAQCITMWVFDWLNGDDSVPLIQRPINMFGIQLSDTRSISTTFAFPTIDSYHSIKAYLAEIGLVSLSDTHIRPKGSVPPAVRRTR